MLSVYVDFGKGVAVGNFVFKGLPDNIYSVDKPVPSIGIYSSEANWSGSALFVICYVNFYRKPGSSNLIGWKLKVGMAS